jgi:DNA gyrase subunit B
VSTSADRSTSYTAHHLQVLEGLEAVRKRPGMYIGSTDSARPDALPVGDHRQRRRRGPRRPLRPIEVILHADGSVEVRDNGRGIPWTSSRAPG